MKRRGSAGVVAVDCRRPLFFALLLVLLAFVQVVRLLPEASGPLIRSANSRRYPVEPTAPLPEKAPLPTSPPSARELSGLPFRSVDFSEDAEMDGKDAFVLHHLVRDERSSTEAVDAATFDDFALRPGDNPATLSASASARLRAVERKSSWSPGLFEGRRPVAVVVGTKSMMRRDLELVRGAYAHAGFTVKTAAELSTAVALGRMESSLRAVRRSEWDVVVCLSLDTSKCLSDADFVRLSSSRLQRINRLRGLRDVLWSKHSFCREMRASVGPTQWLGAFTFPCWVLPRDAPALSLVASRTANAHKSWIVKPLQQGGGKGIFVVDGAQGVASVTENARPHVVQPYLANPHLIGGRKWDLRTYVLVTSVTPLRAYVYGRGLVRFATDKYDASAAGGGKRTQFLTNTSVNKKSDPKRRSGNSSKSNTIAMEDITWSFERLRTWINERHGEGAYAELMRRIERAIAMTLLAAEPGFARRYVRGPSAGQTAQGEKAAFLHDRHTFRCANCFHLLGVDLIVDAELAPRVIEVNGEPSMKLEHRSTSHYDETKRAMARDLVNAVFTPAEDIASALAADLGVVERVWDEQLTRGVRESTEEERGFGWLSDPEMQYLLDSKREQASLGGFRRAYPSASALRSPDDEALWCALLQRIYPGEGKNGGRIRFHRLLGALERVRYWRCTEEGDECSDELTDLRRVLSLVNRKSEERAATDVAGVY